MADFQPGGSEAVLGLGAGHGGSLKGVRSGGDRWHKLRHRGRIMAIEKKKMQDPTEAALSAIEQALIFEDGASAGQQTRGQESRGRSAPRAPEPKLPDAEAHDFTNGPFRDLDRDSRSAPAEMRPKADEPSRPSFVAP